MNLPYVDGGLYAMNLMYALHSLGIGTIPLTCALMARNFNALYRDFDIKDNEVPVLLIGVGNLKDKFEVAVSNRYSYKNYAYFIN
jgi:nitroreductase